MGLDTNDMHRLNVKVEAIELVVSRICWMVTSAMIAVGSVVVVLMLATELASRWFW